jgi:hypothetical protein
MFLWFLNNKFLSGFIFFLTFVSKSVCLYINGHTDKIGKREIKSASAVPSSSGERDEAIGRTFFL